MTDLFNIIQKIKKRVNPNLEILGILINQADGRTLILELIFLGNGSLEMMKLLRHLCSLLKR